MTGHHQETNSADATEHEAVWGNIAGFEHC